jgi:hypothetical protein
MYGMGYEGFYCTVYCKALSKKKKNSSEGPVTNGTCES